MIKYNLEKAINELDITPNRLAVLAEVRPNTIGDLIKGNTKRIELETIEKILDALNYEASRKNKKYYQIQDVIQYEIENSPEPDYGSYFNRETFELLRRILKKTPIQTRIRGLELTNYAELLALYEENITKGVILNSTDNYNALEDALLGMRNQLTQNYLSELVYETSYSKFRLTEKGREFVKLLKKYGTS
ncbi:helix-turn-helix domain-containing protein [Paenibacillus odorifer]|uniref:helix-turn-helix domain-containing protein n=1 Tax=Paenibacillus odorifer TaxID=189426 RepID=UPI00096EF54E|nr:helix-turn-helix transcriptional regulator [Paenibacillus odorifer]OMD69285.1 hypothetical protein BSK50_28835 [Paenibacillus odorifer]